MAKIELTVTEDQKALLRRAADREQLHLATWAKAKLMLLAKNVEKDEQR